MRHNCTLCSECVARFKCVIYYIYQRSTVRGLPWQNNLMVLEGIYLIIYLLSPRFILLAKLFPAYQDGNLLLCNPLKSQLANFGPPAVLHFGNKHSTIHRTSIHLSITIMLVRRLHFSNATENLIVSSFPYGSLSFHPESE